MGLFKTMFFKKKNFWELAKNLPILGSFLAEYVA